jgi:hypothetical protein
MDKDFVYKKYRVRYNPLANMWWIEKNGQHIATVASAQHGRDTIDLLVGRGVTP